MGKAKILLCHNFYQEPGGESSVFENEVQGLENFGHAVTLYSRQNSELDRMGLGAKASLLASAFFSRRTYSELAALVKRERPDVAIVQNVFPLLSPAVYWSLAALRVPIIQAVYNYRFVCPNAHLYTQGQICERCVSGNYWHCIPHRCYQDNPVRSGWYASILGLHRALRTFAGKINRFMAPDHFLAGKLIDGGLPADKMRVNVNPFFADRYKPAYTHEGYLLYVGRLVPQKGVLTLIAAMSRVQSGVRLRIVGQGDLAAQVTQMIAARDLGAKVSFLGPRWGDEVRELMARAQAIVVPSEWYDNLPLIICQANALGKPVIASRINGIPEYVADGANGFLFAPGDAADLAGAIDRVAALPEPAWRLVAQRARRQAEEVFDFAAHYRTLMGIVDELV